MSERVVSLNGEPISVGREVDAALVVELEHMLERARAGELVGLSSVVVWADDTIAMSIVGRCATYRSVGGAAGLQRRLLELVEDD